MSPSDETFIELKYGRLENYNKEEILDFLSGLPDRVICDIYFALHKNKYHNSTQAKISWIKLSIDNPILIPAIKVALLEFRNSNE